MSSINSSACIYNTPIGELTAVDEFLTQNPYEGIVEWQQLIQFCVRLLAAVIGGEIDSETLAPDHLFQFQIHKEYSKSPQSLILIDPPILGAKRKIIAVLENICESGEANKLYKNYITTVPPQLKPSPPLQYSQRHALKHVGQMTGEFPLSPQQRNAFHYFIEQAHGEILAVNGPPGTGKTTLLGSVVANLWTQAALDKTHPPLIVAASNNNQAVTNILESFARIDETGMAETLQGRWLPNMDTYGLYCCSQTKVNGLPKYLYLGPDKEGPIVDLQTADYVNQASKHYLAKANQWQSGKEFYDIEVVETVLHQAMVATLIDIKKGFKLLSTYQAVTRKLEEEFNSLDTLEHRITQWTYRLEILNEEAKKAKNRLDQMYALWEARPWWVLLLSWLVPIRKMQWQQSARLLNQWEIVVDNYRDVTIEEYFHRALKDKKETIIVISKQLSDARTLCENYRRAKKQVETWIQKFKPTKLFSESFADQINEICDRSLRFKLFKLATHYWEARWLTETQEFLYNQDKNEVSPVKLLRKYRRFAKLTPCFVSTLFMVPSFFSGWMYGNKPLFDEIDLLILDEAGQALADVASASFALAKRALVVGDTDQIEPIWNIPESIDRSNLQLFGLLTNSLSYDDYWLTSGQMVSNGNLMRIAQRQCQYHQFEELERGLYLTEHRRCYDSIVSYCNELVYKGILNPLRGNPKKTIPWPTMGLVAIRKPSKKIGSSRGNPGEACAIAQWLLEQYQTILDYARSSDEKLADKSDPKVFFSAVGVVTPFSKQAKLIKSEIKNIGLPYVTVGTVHSLQGDERMIVLFSSVYGDNDKAIGKFYDRGRNMLNVAVSRAKDSFLVFGDESVFGVESPGTPSGILRKRLATVYNNGKMSWGIRKVLR